MLVGVREVIGGGFQFLTAKDGHVQQMNNKGVANHVRFRTKFWQQKQAILNHESLFLDATITGIPLAPSPQPFRRLHPPTLTPSPTTPKEMQLSEGHSYKLRLKMELLDLSSENFATIQPRGVSTEQKSRTERAYRGRQAGGRQTRPGTSLTIEIDRPQRSYNIIEQRLAMYQNKQHPTFMPLRSSRYRPH